MNLKTKGMTITLLLAAAGIVLLAFTAFSIFQMGMLIDSLSTSINGLQLAFITIIWLLITFFFSVMSFLGFEYALDRVEKNANQFREIQNFCYACGTEIRDSKTAKTCPKCNSSLDFESIFFRS